MRNRLIGIGILLVIVGATILFRTTEPSPPATTLHGYVGGEKTGFLDDDNVRSLLRKRFGLSLDYAKAGSIEMVTGKTEGMDFLWPSSQVALELYKQAQGNSLVKGEVIFYSPIVLYSWDIVADALVRQGICRVRDSVYYITDFPALIRMVMSGTPWKSIGLDDLYGKMTIISTDPNKSNSGNMFAGLLADMLCGDVATTASIDTVLPNLAKLFRNLGFLEHSSSDLFLQYLSMGVGAKPIIVGYESQIVEFSVQNAERWPSIRHKIRILYPEPTVWSAHPLIELKPGADQLVKGLKDEDVQKLAWERHGFRTGLMGLQNDPKLLQVVGIPERITKVLPMPSPDVMQKIMTAISSPQ
ncbi:MAG TPA: hypothetical protein VMG09_16550 [Bacteroidota bacterium]|nr:hypothetical protein [Bacteroidota bacterium]